MKREKLDTSSHLKQGNDSQNYIFVYICHFQARIKPIAYDDTIIEIIMQA